MEKLAFAEKFTKFCEDLKVIILEKQAPLGGLSTKDQSGTAWIALCVQSATTPGTDETLLWAPVPSKLKEKA